MLMKSDSFIQFQKGKHEGGRSIEKLREFVEKMIKDHNTEMKGEEEKTHEVDETKDQGQESTDEYLPSDHSHVSFDVVLYPLA